MRILMTHGWCEDCNAQVEVWQVRLGVLARGFIPACRFFGRVLGAALGLTAGLASLYVLAHGLTDGVSGLVAFWRTSGALWRGLVCCGLAWAICDWFGFRPRLGCPRQGSLRLRRMARRVFNRMFGLRGCYWRFATEPPICGRCGSERIRPLGVESVAWALDRAAEINVLEFHGFLRELSAALLVGEQGVKAQRLKEKRERDQERRARERAYRRMRL